MYSNRVEGLFAALKISSTGLTAQRRRLNAIAENLANIHTTKTPEGGPFKRRITRFTEMSQKSTFYANLAEKRLALSTPRIGHRGLDIGASVGEFTGVRATQELDDSDPLLVYDPKHPDADQFGYVEMPNINVVTEMVDMLSAQRAYEANVTALKATKDMARKALEI